MFLSWGSGSKVAEVGPAGLRHCGHCGQDAPFTGMVEYAFRHIYGFFRWVTDRTPYMICGNCGGVHDPDPDAYDSPEVRKAIPLWDRRGWLIGLAGIAAVAVAGSFAAAADRSQDGMFIAAPVVGDRYEADFAQILADAEAERMYGVMRVTQVDESNIELELGRTYYDDWRGPDRDLRKGRAIKPAYYSPERLKLPRAALREMFDRGIIHDVQR
jgi:hypothetical protein